MAPPAPAALPALHQRHATALAVGCCAAASLCCCRLLHASSAPLLHSNAPTSAVTPLPPLTPSLQTGSISPSILPSQQQRELLELAVKSCKSLGLQIVRGDGGDGMGGQGSPALA